MYVPQFIGEYKVSADATNEPFHFVKWGKPKNK